PSRRTDGEQRALSGSPHRWLEITQAARGESRSVGRDRSELLPPAAVLLPGAARLRVVWRAEMDHSRFPRQSIATGRALFPARAGGGARGCNTIATANASDWRSLSSGRRRQRWGVDYATTAPPASSW